jgi:hypothetical protein
MPENSHAISTRMGRVVWRGDDVLLKGIRRGSCRKRPLVASLRNAAAVREVGEESRDEATLKEAIWDAAILNCGGNTSCPLPCETPDLLGLGLRQRFAEDTQDVLCNVSVAAAVTARQMLSTSSSLSVSGRRGSASRSWTFWAYRQCDECPAIIRSQSSAVCSSIIVILVQSFAQSGNAPTGCPTHRHTGKCKPVGVPLVDPGELTGLTI